MLICAYLIYSIINLGSVWLRIGVTVPKEMKLMLLAHKVGFGLKPDEDMPEDAIGWALAQLANKAPQVGISRFRAGKQQIEPWPEEFIFDLTKRVKTARQLQRELDKLDDDSGLSSGERRRQEQALRQKFQPHAHDQLTFFHQPVFGEDGVRQRFVQFWMNHFTVGANSNSNDYAGDLFQNVMNRDIDGRFADMAYNVTRHPTMLCYLDNIYNIGETSEKAKNNKKRQVGLNDNLGRELMELHTISPAAGYSEDDIRDAAKILAGWGFLFHKKDGARFDRKNRIKDYGDAFVTYHAEPGGKTVLGKTYPNGKKALRLFIDDLAAMPETAAHISRKLCQHFISDNPTDDDVNAVIAAWQRSDGDLPSVHKAVIERAALDNSPKMQWPLTWLFTLSRTSGGNLTYGWDDIGGKDPHEGVFRPRLMMRELGQNIWGRRQPDGFALDGASWATPEHMERRIRMASIMHRFGNPQLDANDMLERIDASTMTRDLVTSTSDPRNKFIFMACSREMMGSV